MPYKDPKDRLAWMRRYRASHLEQCQAYEAKYQKSPKRKASEQARQQRDAEKVRARWVARTAVRDGRLAKMPCEVCGAQVVQAHHEDYSKPLDVRWFCKKHHDLIHKQECK